MAVDWVRDLAHGLLVEPWIYHDPDPAIVGDEIIRQDNCPAGTDNTVENVAKVLEAAYKQTPSVPTYVIALGDSADNLVAMATAGGTDPVRITDDTEAKLLETLRQIQVETFACDMPIPEPTGGPIDYAQVNVAFTHSDGTEQRIYFNDSTAAQCAGEGWRYDTDPKVTPPSEIQLCTETCDMVQGDMSGQLNVLFGCARWVL